MTARPLRIGTRGSPLALAQAEIVHRRLVEAHPELDGQLRVVAIRTSGDRISDRSLAQLGGKALFTKEIEEALLGRRIDLAVHSSKDLETFLPQGLEIVCVPPREDPRDAFVSPKAGSLDDLPSRALVGTSSLRRQAQLLRRRPDLRIAPFRGNIGTRMKKLREGEADATILAYCGLLRLGEEGLARQVLAPEVMLPAIGQGALAIECRADDEALKERLAALHDAPSAACVFAERAVLAALGGSCRTPIAALAVIEGGRIALEAALFTPDGSAEIRARRRGAVGEAAALGADLGEELRRRAGADFGLE
jgi:hydroxymethylbilane synthase